MAWTKELMNSHRLVGPISVIFNYQTLIDQCQTDAGSNLKLNYLVYEPPRNGPTLWEIGVPDRTAAEFYIPDPYPTLMNELYNNHPDK